MRPSTLLRVAVAAAAAAALTPRESLGQQPGFAGVSGVVIDSINGVVPLVGATIKVGNTGRQAVTDSSGEFLVDSVPPGEHAVTLLHPLLDSLNIKISTRPTPFRAGQMFTIELAVPSATRVVELSCARAWRARGPSALVGTVLDADTDKPLQGAKVTLVWQEIVLATLRKETRVREATVGEDGGYRICGLPAGLTGNIQATFDGQKTAEVAISIDETHPLAFQSLRIGTTVVVEAPPSDTAGRPAGTNVATASNAESVPPRLKGPARRTGRVINAAGAPGANARVDVQGTGAATLSRQDGSFGFTDLPSGTQQVVVRQLGFQPVEVPVELSGRTPKQITVTLAKPAPVLEAVAVTAERSTAGLDQVGFNRRHKSGFGYFVTPEDIENRQATRMTDLFRTIPSLRVVPSGMDYVVESARDAAGGCVRYVVDGSPYQALFAGDIDRMMPPHEVAAIEVYTGSNTPVEFQSPGGSSCTTIVMWSRFKVKRDRK
ncbi:MAG: TonB-dependent receptor plug [Geminicoccaceae bacterium]|nr:TonB-dependent receptor plug [Geminicoccaceae bacterium]